MYPFILTSLAGFATLIGTLPIFVKINDKSKLIASACSFASGVMICVSILDLIPESLNYLINNYENRLKLLGMFKIKDLERHEIQL